MLPIIRRPNPLPLLHIPRLRPAITKLRRRPRRPAHRAAAGGVALFDVLDAWGVEGVGEGGVVEEGVGA